MENKISAKFTDLDFPSYNASEIYIMDYTDQTGGDRGVECRDDKAPDDIDAFIINNHSLLDISFCAFIDKKFKLKESAEKELSHCEGILFPTVNDNTTWIAFIELKYPKKRENLGSNLKEARQQLLSTLKVFREQEIIEAERLVYLIFSAPKYTFKTPFENWCMEPGDLRVIRKTKYAIMLGVNSINIISNEKIKRVI